MSLVNYQSSIGARPVQDVTNSRFPGFIPNAAGSATLRSHATRTRARAKACAVTVT